MDRTQPQEEQKYYIGDAITKPAIHHDSFKALWETKWRLPCRMGVYPFMFGSILDFEPIVEDIIRNDLKEPYNWDEYASYFFPKAEELKARAAEAEAENKKEKASELYLRASAVYRIARFPTPRSPKQKEAWTKGKEVFYKGQSLRHHPIREVRIQHIQKGDGDGDVIPVNYLVPQNASQSNPVPLVFIITGLDGYRTELAVWQEGWMMKGVATLVVEIPGTGDSPAAKQDPTSPDRQWSSVLDWIDQRKEIDNKRIIVWGFSTGGYYALRLAHTHKARLMGSISLGGGAHHMFDRVWLQNVNKLEYPFDLADTLSYKFGFPDLESFIDEAPKFSLLLDGTLEKPCTQMLLVNGTEDEIFPIDDLFVALEHGLPKEARMIRGAKHMGEPDSFSTILKWIYAKFELIGDVKDQISMLPSRAKY